MINYKNLFVSLEEKEHPVISFLDAQLKKINKKETPKIGKVCKIQKNFQRFLKSYCPFILFEFIEVHCLIQLQGLSHQFKDKLIPKFMKWSSLPVYRKIYQGSLRKPKFTSLKWTKEASLKQRELTSLPKDKLDMKNQSIEKYTLIWHKESKSSSKKNKQRTQSQSLQFQQIYKYSHFIFEIQKKGGKVCFLKNFNELIITGGRQTHQTYDEIIDLGLGSFHNYTHILYIDSGLILRQDDMPNKKCKHSICYVNGKVYCVGGIDYGFGGSVNYGFGKVQTSRTTDIFHVDKNEWTAGPKNHVGNHGVTLIVVADRYIYQFGGGLADGNRDLSTPPQYSFVQRLDTHADNAEWEFYSISDWWRTSDQYCSYSIIAVPINYHREHQARFLIFKKEGDIVNDIDILFQKDETIILELDLSKRVLPVESGEEQSHFSFTRVRYIQFQEDFFPSNLVESYFNKCSISFPISKIPDKFSSSVKLDNESLGLDFVNHQFYCIVGKRVISIISVDLEMTVFKTAASIENLQYLYKFYKSHISHKPQSHYLKQTNKMTNSETKQLRTKLKKIYTQERINEEEKKWLKKLLKQKEPVNHQYFRKEREEQEDHRVSSIHMFFYYTKVALNLLPLLYMIYDYNY